MLFRIILSAIGLLLSLSPVQAQQQKNESPTFKSRTDLIVVPVLVNDKDGKPITGLKQNDFTLFENGSEAKLAFFDEVNTASDRVQRVPPEAGTFTNALTGPSRTNRVTIMVLDLLNTEVRDQQYARDQLTKYLAESLDADEPTALFVLNRQGLWLIHDFTSDPKILIDAVKKMRELHTPAAPTAVEQEQIEASIRVMGDRMGASPVGNDVMSSFIDAVVAATKDVGIFQQGVTIRQTLMAMQQLAQHAKGIPGRKALVWATGSFPFQIGSVEESFSRPARETFADLYPLYESTWLALVSANIAVYPVDVRGLMPQASLRADLRWSHVGIAASREELNSPVDWAQLQSFDALRAFAQATGGKAFLNNNDITKGFKEAAEDSSHYYLLSFYLDKNAKPGWHKLSVKTAKNDVSVRSRTGFVVTTSSESKAIEEVDIFSALRSPLNYTEIPIVLRWSTQGDAKEKGRRQLGYEVEMPADAVVIDDSNKSRMALQFLALVRDADGKEVGHPESRKLDLFLSPQSLQQVRDSGITYRNTIELPPGDYNVRFVVRDVLSGKMGSVSAPVSVRKG